MIFTNFDRHALYDIMNSTWSKDGPEDRYKYFKKSTDIPAGGRYLQLAGNHLDAISNLGSDLAVANYADQLPPFTITLTAMNEYGNISVMHILGVELINEGSGVSIDDIVTETQMTFVARSILGWRPMASARSTNRRVDTKNVVSQLNELAVVNQAELFAAQG